MRELTMSETDQTGGGWVILAGLLGAIIGQYIHDQLGGADGIDEIISDTVDFITQAAEESQSSCEPIYGGCY